MWLGILGPLEVTIGSAPIRIPGLRQRRILAALALHPNVPVTTDRLIEVLWGTTPPRTAREQVQNCVGQLVSCVRTKSGASPIVRNKGSYRLAVSDTALDMLQFEKAIRESHDLHRAGLHNQAQRARRSALDLWRGDVLTDVLTDGMQARVTRIEELHTTVVEHYAEAALQLGDHDSAIAELSATVPCQPLNERLTGLLIHALRETGRPAEALAAYARIQDRLAGELGVRPGPALVRQQRAILQDSPVVHRRPAPRRSSPAFGRGTAGGGWESTDPSGAAHQLATRHDSGAAAVRLLMEATQLLGEAVSLLQLSTQPDAFRRLPRSGSGIT